MAFSSALLTKLSAVYSPDSLHIWLTTQKSKFLVFVYLTFVLMHLSEYSWHVYEVLVPAHAHGASSGKKIYQLLGLRLTDKGGQKFGHVIVSTSTKLKLHGVSFMEWDMSSIQRLLTL